MATLIRNVWAGGEFWGPDYGNADYVPDSLLSEIPPDAWSGPCWPKATAPAAAPEAPEFDRAALLAEAERLGLDVSNRPATKRLAALVARHQETT